MRRYFALVHKDPHSAYGVQFPDLPAVDATARARGLNRSSFLATAARHEMEAM